MKRLETVQRIIIHHSERDLDFPEHIRYRHTQTRGWEDIGYHYLIGNGKYFTTDGKIYAGRHTAFQGAHVYGENHDSLSIALIGNLDVSTPSTKQIKALRALTQTLLKKHGLTPNNVAGHEEVTNTHKTCPGKHVDLDTLRETLRKT